MAPLASILNYEQFVGEAIESSLHLSFDKIEILAFGDGSPAIIKSYSPVSEENGWQALAFNDQHCREPWQHRLFSSCLVSARNKVAAIVEIFARLDDSNNVAVRGVIASAVCT